ncbi:hypothetical protein [Virgibacillus necropolis]|uniref:hypothetical protein n=1 Tax=Virgibacillus necropolis TaxID=163877 RepID=UPI0014572532|nr:hypothetical protein [Virgibacillus necropolis]
MDKKKKKPQINDDVVAPGVDEQDSFGAKATQSEIEEGESTKVTRLVYDEYDPSEK